MFSLFGRIPPLLLFLIVGGALFAVEEWRLYRDSETSQINVSGFKVEQLERTLMQRYGRQPSSNELNAELQAYIDEELLYREALRLGLHQSDEVVRRRLAQTMAFIIEGKADLENPGDSELKAWYEQTRPDARLLTRIDFRHVFFSFDRSKGISDHKMSSSLEKLDSGDLTSTAIGEPFLLGSEFNGMSLVKISNSFGQKFADALADLEPGQWEGPISSNYGHHLVLIEQREQAQLIDFEQQRDQLVNAWRIERRREIREQALDQLRQEFDIDIEIKEQVPQLAGQL